MIPQKEYAWAVVGAGPAGITAIGLLLDAGVPGDEIAWIDPHFQIGDFGRLWGEVNSNTRVSLFLNYLNGVTHFNYDKKPHALPLDLEDHNGFVTLETVTDSLRWVCDQLREKVTSISGTVCALCIEKKFWKIQTDNQHYYARKIILATGADPKSLDYPEVEKIELVTALSPSALKKVCHSDDVVAVFGSSHSAMIVIRRLVEMGVKHIMNFYLSPIRYAVMVDNWILYDDTGLKGDTARWVHDNISAHCLAQISRHLSTPDNIEKYLPLCNKVVYAVGFQQRHISVEGVSLRHYDITNGIIAPGLFGAGIGFPIAVTDPFGRQEWNVGLWKFLKNMRKSLPVWQRYDL